MKILMIGNTATVGHNLRLGLQRKGHEVRLISNINIYDEGEVDSDILWRDIIWGASISFQPDVVHIHAPHIKKFGIALHFLNNDTKLVCHWHGTNLRNGYHHITNYWLFPWLFRHADFHLYSTCDLVWWLRSIPNKKRMLFRCPVDTDLFNIKVPVDKREKEMLVLNNQKKLYIPHNQMPDLYNQYRLVGVDVNAADEIPSVVSPLLVSVSGLEAAACGCGVVFHPYMNRRWVVENASIESQTRQLLEVYHTCGVS